jgi:hypothetical protein
MVVSAGVFGVSSDHYCIGCSLCRLLIMIDDSLMNPYTHASHSRSCDMQDVVYADSTTCASLILRRSMPDLEV